MQQVTPTFVSVGDGSATSTSLSIELVIPLGPLGDPTNYLYALNAGSAGETIPEKPDLAPNTGLFSLSTAPGGEGGGGGGTTTPPPPVVPPALVAGTLKVRGGQTLGEVFKTGFKFKLKTTATAPVKATLKLSKKLASKLHLGKKAVVVAKGSKTVGPQGAAVSVKFTQKAKRAITKFYKAAKLPLTLDVSVAGKPAATQLVKIQSRRR